MGHTGLGWVMQGWGESCRSGLGWVMQGWAVVDHAGVGLVMQGCSGSYRGRVRVIQGWVM